MNRKEYIITLDQDADPDAVASALQSKGMNVENVLREIGVISASSDAADIASLRGLKGVKAVEESGSVQLPPPESPVQ